MKMEINQPETKDRLLVRLRKVEGQVKGIQSMVEAERNCRDILQQLAAVRAAVQSISQEYLKQYAMECMVNLDTKNEKERETLAQELVSIMGRNC